MNEETQEVRLTVGKSVIPADLLTYDDPVYGKRVFIRTGEQYTEVTKPPKEPIRTHADRTYSMHESGDFVAAIQKCGAKPETGIIFFQGAYGQNDTVVTMFFDEKTREEKISLPLQKSLELRQFFNRKPGTGEFAQKDFLKLLDTFPECIENVNTLRPNVEHMQMNATIDFESKIDPNNIVFTYKERGGSQDGKIPRKLKLTMPFYEGSEKRVEIEVDVEINMPKEEGAKPVFTLVNVKHERTEREALKAEIASLQEKLPDWTFVNGKYT